MIDILVHAQRYPLVGSYLVLDEALAKEKMARDWRKDAAGLAVVLLQCD